MLKLTLGECRNQIRYYKYIAYNFWEQLFLLFLQSTILSKYLRRFIIIPHPPAGQTACSCLSCENMRVGAQLCLQKCENVLSLRASFVGLLPWHSSIQCFVQSLFKDSPNWVYSVSHSKPTHLFKWRSPLPPSPGHPDLWRDSAAISWVLSCLHGRGKKPVNTKHFMAKTVKKCPCWGSVTKGQQCFSTGTQNTLQELSRAAFFFPLSDAHSTRLTMWTMTRTDVIWLANSEAAWLINKTHEFMLQNCLASWEVSVLNRLLHWKQPRSS